MLEYCGYICIINFKKNAMKDMRMRLIDRGFTAEEIDANPEVLQIMEV